MIRKIFNTIIFSAAIAVAVLAMIFCYFWYWGDNPIDDEDSEKNRTNVMVFKQSDYLQSFPEGKQLCRKFLQAEVTDIGSQTNPGPLYTEIDNYVTVKQDSCATEEALAKDFFSYLSILQSLREKDFENFMQYYPYNMSKLLDPSGEEFTFGKGYVGTFKEKVKTYNDMKEYISTDLLKQYTDFKRAQLDKEEQLKAVKMLHSRETEINVIPSFDTEQKSHTLEKYQKMLRSFLSYHVLLSVTFYIAYCLGGLALIAILFFIIFRVSTDFKNSYTILIIFGGIALIGFICYLIAQPDVTNVVFARQGISPILGKFIEASAYMTYTMLGLGIFSMIFTPLINIFIKNNKLK